MRKGCKKEIEYAIPLPVHDKFKFQFAACLQEITDWGEWSGEEI